MDSRVTTSRTSRGMTLLEVVVALSLLMVLLLGLASGMTSGMSLDALTRERVAATIQAASRMDEVVALDWDQLPTRDGETFDVTLTSEQGNYTLPAGGG